MAQTKIASSTFKKAGQAKPRDPQEFYTKLIIYRGKQFSLAILVGLFTLAATILIFKDIEAGRHWLAIVAPVTLFGILFILFPATEKWEYKPWQDNARQVERHLID